MKPTVEGIDGVTTLLSLFSLSGLVFAADATTGLERHDKIDEAAVRCS